MAQAVNATRPAYWSRAKRVLAGSDPTLARIVAAHPRVALASRGDAFTTLARAIVGQQISVKAVESVWTRFCGVCGKPTPERVRRRRATTRTRGQIIGNVVRWSPALGSGPLGSGP